MRKAAQTLLLLCLTILVLMNTAMADTGSAWNCPQCGQSGNIGNYCSNCACRRPGTSWNCPVCNRTGNSGNYCEKCGTARPDQEIWALAIDRLSINAGPGTSRYFDEIGTYRVKGQYVRVFAKSWDTDNDIWWIQCEIPGTNHVIGWTGLKRFDQSTFDLDALPEVVYDRKTRKYVY